MHRISFYHCSTNDNLFCKPMDRLMNNETINRLVEAGVQRLRPLPAVAARLLALVNSPYSSADDVAALMEKDPALTGTVLKMANSAFYGMPRSVSNVNAAIVVLGFNAVRSIALTSAIAGAVPVGSLDAKKFWKHSVTVAAAAKFIAGKLDIVNAPDSETAFCAGILHDIGRIVLDISFPGSLKEIRRITKEKFVPTHRAEFELFGVNHNRVGSRIAERWGLPPELECAMVYHHEPLACEGEQIIALITAFADVFAHRVKCGTYDDEPVPLIPLSCAAPLGLDTEKIESLFNEFEKTAANSSAYIDAMGIS